MRKFLIIILAIILLGSGLYYLNLENKTGDKVEENIPEEDLKEDKNSTFVEGPGEYPIEENIVSQVVDIEVGKEAPNFTLKNLDGQEISLSDYRGKIVLINFWATWCKFCDLEMPDLQKLDKENDDLVILAVDVMEDKKVVEDYIKKGGYDFNVVLDEEGDIAKTYLVSGFPTSYFVDKDGVLLGGVPGMMTFEQMNQILEGIR